jgi:hypothetical protein
VTGLLVYGDPHGDWKPLLHACAQQRPDSLVIVGDYAEGNIHACWVQAGGLIVAGLGGDFKERIWYPRFDYTVPAHATRRSYLRQLRRADRWQGGLPLRVRDAIFPEDIEALCGLRVDLLVTHEAPTCRRHGFAGIDMAAETCKARLLVHGHHHDSYSGVTKSGIRVRGLKRAEVLRFGPEDFA